jgi:aspartate/methionine/tyrosine aminotransferase
MEKLDPSSKESVHAGGGAGVSTRLHRIRGIPSHAYGAHHMDAAKNLYSSENHGGNVPLAVAENRLLAAEMTDKLNSVTDYPPYVLTYTNSRGLPVALETFSLFLKRRVFGLPEEQTVWPRHLTISAGCVALLYQLSYLLFEPSDSLLIPTPYYPAFDRDFLTLGEVASVEVFKDPGSVTFGLTEESLNAAYESSLQKGKFPKGLLLTNPCNPTGTVYTREELLLAVAWCRTHHMHMLCDEVYALSVYGEHPFESIVSVLDNDLGDDVHVMWSMSKDFGCSGVRLGVLYSQNELLNDGLSATNDAFMSSNICQYAVSRILADDEFVNNYLTLLKSRLRGSHDALMVALQSIKTVRAPQGLSLAMDATAGIFVFVDLRSLLSEQTFTAERVLNQALLARGVVLTPGGDCHAALPGYFRLCFAWVELECLLEGVRRIGEYARDVGLLLD